MSVIGKDCKLDYFELCSEAGQNSLCYVNTWSDTRSDVDSESGSITDETDEDSKPEKPVDSCSAKDSVLTCAPDSVKIAVPLCDNQKTAEGFGHQEFYVGGESETPNCAG